MIGTKSDVVMWLMRQDDGVLFEAKEYKGLRSNKANSYFHVLCRELSNALSEPFSHIKNHLIADYGQPEYIDGEPMIYKTNAPVEYMMSLEEFHTKLIKVTEENGREVYWYRVNRGTHTYNTMEMYHLIEGALQECQAQGIKTMTPNEIKEMFSLCGQ